MQTSERLRRWLAAALLALCAATPVLAEDDPPGRIGRVADLQGPVSIFDAERGEWVPVSRNRPLTSGDRISTASDGRAELRVGSTTLRLAGASELEVLRIDDDRVSVQLHSGSLALRVRSREVADETEVVTAEVRLRPLRGGHYRIDRIDDSTWAASWRGELRVDDGGDSFNIDAGRRAEIWREGAQRGLRHDWATVPDDAFASWALREDERDERSAANRYVSPEMTGAEELDRNGRWEQHPDYGALWVPLSVRAGWAPYRYGHWGRIRPWGWTWVDDAPWGFAPFHYGRWVSWGGRWCWSPGPYVARPVYAPALVAWVGGPNLSVSVNIGGPLMPAVGWVPLAPREVFVPWYRASPVYGNRVNHGPPGRPPLHAGPAVYGNQGVPGGVTMVPRDVMVRRQPVDRAVIDLRGREALRQLPATPAAAPQAPPMALLPKPGPGPGPVRGRPGLAPPESATVPRPQRPPTMAADGAAPQAPPPLPVPPQVRPVPLRPPPAAVDGHAPRPDHVFTAPPVAAPAATTPAAEPRPRQHGRPDRPERVEPAQRPAPAAAVVPAPAPAAAPPAAAPRQPAAPPPAHAVVPPVQPPPQPQPQPVAPAPPRPKPPDAREAPRDDSRSRIPESRSNMGEREAVR